jgi:predicted regulator of Ras-like GTPase activity (Roadblock/LC7/MglB family)
MWFERERCLMTDPYAAAVSGAEGRSLQLDQILRALLRQVPDVEAASVVSFDGLPMASALPPGMDEDRVAAMSAALLSLGERAAQGLGRGDLSQVYVEGDNGTVFLVSADDEAVLVAVGRVGAKVGLMLYEVKQAAAAVGTALRVQAEPLPPIVPVSAPEPVHQAVPVPQPQPVQVQESAQPQPVQSQPVQVQESAQPQPVQSQPVQAQPVQAQPAPSASVATSDDTVNDNGSSDRYPHLAPAHPDDRRPAVVASDGSSWS